MGKKTLFWIGTAILVAGVLGSAKYVRDMSRAYTRVAEKGELLTSPYGVIEYTDIGSGPAALVIHGSGGGYDQGELIAGAVLGESFRWITPSRFGYLGSTFQQGATWDDQAHAYAFLLDHLGIERIPVVAMSHGGPSALLFAVLYPERVASLTLVSCGVVTLPTPDQAEANRKGRLLTTIFKLDLSYWALSGLFKSSIMRLIGASDAVVTVLSADQRELVENVIDYMNPASLRSAGVTFDNEGTLPGERITAIRAPTLIFHAKDDTLQLYENAQFAASNIPDARLISFDRGGHIVVALEQESIRAATTEHILDERRELPE